jgi:hypothetical protein
MYHVMCIRDPNLPVRMRYLHDDQLHMEVYLINLIQFVMRCVTFTSGFMCQCNDVVGS